MMVSEKDLTKEQKAVLFIIDRLGERFSIDNLYIQKAVFLVSKLLPESIAIYDYEPHNMGMFSPEVESIIKREQDLGLIKDLNVTSTGKRVIETIQKEDDVDEINQVFVDINELGKEDILYLLYQLYPEFTVNSKIKERVDSYKLQSATIDLIKLKEGDEITIKTDKGNFIKLKKTKDTVKITDYEEGKNNVKT